MLQSAAHRIGTHFKKADDRSEIGGMGCGACFRGYHRPHCYSSLPVSALPQSTHPMHTRVSVMSISLASCPLRSGHADITPHTNVHLTMAHERAANLWLHGYCMLCSYVHRIWVAWQAMHHPTSACCAPDEWSNSLILINELPWTTECSWHEHLR